MLTRSMRCARGFVGARRRGDQDRSRTTAPEALAHKVREMGADAGIALDGDDDRMIVVDQKPIR
jgi:phosphomannomutase